jgi:CBS domain containing-hemolysin-like protein
MVGEFLPLKSRRLPGDAGIDQPVLALPEKVSLDDPAVGVMTDLTRMQPVTIEPHAAVAEANRRMIDRAVRLLFVLDGDGGLVGLVTASDVLGPRPMQVVSERGVRHNEVLVRDVMTPARDLEAVELADVYGAKVGHVVAMLKATGRQHGLVVQRDAAGRQRVRGLFSVTQIARQLGAPIHANELARTFAEIESLLR